MKLVADKAPSNWRIEPLDRARRRARSDAPYLRWLVKRVNPGWPAGLLLILLLVLTALPTAWGQGQVPPGSADLRVGQTASGNRVNAGSDVTFTAAITNDGPSSATGVTLTTAISPRATFLSSAPSAGTCTLAAGILTCRLGNLAPGGVASVAIILRAGAGTNQSLVSVVATESDPNPTNNTSTRFVVGVINVPDFVNGDATFLPEIEPGPADIYPLNIQVSGWTSRIDRVVVVLRELTHFWPDDLDLLLVGPAGHRLLLMSDCGLDNPLTAVRLTFDDDAATSLPDSDPAITSGTYKPTNFGTLSDNLASPAPPGPYGTNLSVFKGQSANGTWSLYVMDDSPENEGFIENGWSLRLTFADPLADIRLGASGEPASISIGNTVIYSVAVTNVGPAQSPTSIRHELPSGFQFVRATPSRGSCTNASGEVLCDFGNLAVGGTASASIELAPTLGGTFTNRISALTTQFDPNPTNNTANIVTSVASTADIGIARVDAPATALLEQVISLAVTVTNRGPGASSRVWLTNALPASLTFISATGAVASCQPAGESVVCDFGSMSAAAAATVTIRARARTLGAATNVVWVGGPDLDFVLGNNSATNIIQIQPIILGADLALTAIESASPVWLGETVNYQVRVTNLGPSTATSVQVTNRLPTGISFIGMTASGGVCSQNGGLITCEIPSLARGAGAVISINGRSVVVAPGTNLATAVAAEFDPVLANNAANSPGSVVSSSGVFSQATGVTIPDVGSGSPYPSTIFVTGLTASVLRVRVALTNLTHSFPDDLDLVLVGPGGQSTYLMSDAGGEFAVNNAVVVFDDGAPALGDNAPISTEVVRPSNFEVPDSFPPPAPGNNYATNLTVFTGTDPNGIWSLYVVDDSSKDRGSLTSWSLNFATVDPIADLRLTQTLSANPAPVGSPVSLRFVVTNAGPAVATDARLTNRLGAAVSGMSVTTSQGVCSMLSGDLVCAFGNIVKDGSAEVVLTGTPLATQTVTNIARVSARETDLHPADNTRTTVLNFGDPHVSANEAPTLDPIDNQTIPEDSVPRTLSLSGITSGASSEIQHLQVTATSSQPGVIAPPVVTYQSAATTGTLVLAPVPDATGTSVITVTVTDGAVTNYTFTRTFTVTVTPTPDAPHLSAIPSMTTREDVPVSVPFTIFDPDSTDDFVLMATSSDLFLVSPGGLVFSGSGANRTLTVTPAVNQVGTTIIRVIATDRDGMAATNEFQLFVSSVNDRPTLALLNDLTVREDNGPTPVTLTGIGSGAANEVETLTVTATSSRPDIIPHPVVTYSSPAATGTLTFTPAADAVGTATLTVTVSDGQPEHGSFSRTFNVTVTATNDAPTLSPITAFTMLEDETNLVAVTITDAETQADLLIISAQSSNPTLIAATNIAFTGSGSNRFVVLTPRLNQSGTATITVLASDGVASNQTTFNLTVAPVNDPPTLNPLLDLNGTTSPGLMTLPLTGISSGAANESQTLAVSVSTTNPSLFSSQPSVSYSSPNSTGTLLYRPSNSTTGSATINVTVNDGGGGTATLVRSFVLTVRTSANVLPTIAIIPPQTINEDTTGGPVTITVRDAETAATSLTLTAFSTNPDLIPNSNLQLNGSGGTRSISFSPRENQSGTGSIVLTVTDAAFGSSNLTFGVTVNPVNDVPTVSSIQAQTILENTSTGFLPFTVGDVETSASQLNVTASSSAPLLVPNNRIELGGSGAVRSLRVTPLPETTGTATITVRVSDGQATTATTFDVNVAPANDPPTLSTLTNVALDEDTPSTPVHFIAFDAETPADNLVYTGESSQPSLVDATGLVFGGAGTNRTLTVTPKPNQSGTAVITVSVTDGVASAVSAFELTVLPVNDPPAMGTIANQVVAADGVRRSVALTGIGSGADDEVQQVAVTASTDQPALLLSLKVDQQAGSSEAVLSFIPVPGAVGTATVMVTANDGQAINNIATRTFTVTLNQPPTIAYVPDVTTDEDVSTLPIVVSLADPDGAVEAVMLAGASMDSILVPPEGLAINGAGASRQLTVTPGTNQAGATRILLVATDVFGASATNSFFLTVRPMVEPIVITLQPRNLVALVGSTPTFDVQTTSTLPLTYQWQFENTDLSGATNSFLALPAVDAERAGIYRVVISSAEVSVVSQGARLTVLSMTPAPVITSIGRTGSSVVVAFESATGGSYTLETKNSLADAAWRSLGSVPGSGEIQTLTDPEASSQSQFYRVRAE